MSDIRKSLLGVILGLAMLVILVSLLGSPAAPRFAYADTVPTPVSAQAGSGSTSWLAVTFASASAKTTDAGSTAQQLPGYDTLDYQYVIDQHATDVNTITLTIQWSNDNTNWSDGPNLVASNAADADGMVQAANMGRYTRVYFNVTNTNPVTVTVKAIAKP